MSKVKNSRWGILKNDNKEAYREAIALRVEGSDYKDIAKALNEKGHSTGSGKPFTSATAWRLIDNKGRIGVRRKSGKRKGYARRVRRSSDEKIEAKPAVKSALEDKIELLSLVMASNISESRKIDVIKGLVNG